MSEKQPMDEASRLYHEAAKRFPDKEIRLEFFCGARGAQPEGYHERPCEHEFGSPKRTAWLEGYYFAHTHWWREPLDRSDAPTPD